MNSAKLRQINRGREALVCVLLLVVAGCRHPMRRATEQAAVSAGDPATNVMIVPASAEWARRAGATNRLPAGIVSSQPFPFPLYDQPLVRLVYDRWRALLKAQPQADSKGQVVIEFDLRADGSISRLHLLPSAVSQRLEHLCERAIVELAPFPKWTPEMTAEIGAESRSIRIGFEYTSGPAGP